MLPTPALPTPSRHPWKRTRVQVRLLRRPVHRYLTKFSGTPAVPPKRQALGHILTSWVGALIAIGTLGWMSNACHAPLMMASFGASCVLLFGYPESPFAQPRNTIGGHLLAAATGLIAAHLLGEQWPVLALSVATAIAVMKLTRTVHPPAGSTAIIAAHVHLSWSFLVLPVAAGAALLVVLASLYNNGVEHRRYPLYWF